MKCFEASVAGIEQYRSVNAGEPCAASVARLQRVPSVERAQAELNLLDVDRVSKSDVCNVKNFISGFPRWDFNHV